MKKYKILILGASYGSLLGTKFALAGHSVKMIFREKSAKVFNTKGALVRTPVKGRSEPVEISSINALGNLSAGTFATFGNGFGEQVDHAVVRSIDTAGNVGRSKNRRFHQ